MAGPPAVGNMGSVVHAKGGATRGGLAPTRGKEEGEGTGGGDGEGYELDKES